MAQPPIAIRVAMAAVHSAAAAIPLTRPFRNVEPRMLEAAMTRPAPLGVIHSLCAHDGAEIAAKIFTPPFMPDE